MITIKIGNIFESKMDVKVNTINCVGVMGKGIAKIYKDLYPSMFEEYKSLCTQKKITTGNLYPYFENNQLKVINFPTKQHWRSPSKLEYITSGLDWFVNNYQSLDIKSIAFPPLGCGNGGLEWQIVGPIMYQKLFNLPIDIEIYAPYGTDKKYLSTNFLSIPYQQKNFSGIVYEKVDKNWLLVLNIVKHLEQSEYCVKVGRVVFQKICYVLSRYGTNLNLEFSKGAYGPYSSDIKKMITILSNNNLIYEKEYGEMMLIKVNDNFKIDKSLYSEKDCDNVNQTFNLFRRIKDTEQAELITTILYSFDELSYINNLVTENQLFQYIISWKERLNNPTQELRIRELSKELNNMNLIHLDYSKDYKESDLYY